MPRSTRELAKFIISFLHEPVLPLPPEPVTIIGAYLEKHEKLDDAASDRLNDELLAMYQNHVLGSPTKYAAFLAILRLLRPAIRTPSRVLQWWDRLIEPILDSLAQEKGLAHEAVKHITDLLDFEDAESLAEDAEPGLNSFAQRLLNWWIEHDSALDVEDVAVGDLKERFVQKALLTLAKKDPKVK